jgi:hypothetical protein
MARTLPFTLNAKPVKQGFLLLFSHWGMLTTFDTAIEIDPLFSSIIPYISLILF